MPGLSNTWAATGPVASFLLLTPALLPVFQVVPDTGEPRGSPNVQVYSRSWKGLEVTVVSVVADASKKTASGATPEVRAATREMLIGFAAGAGAAITPNVAVTFTPCDIDMVQVVVPVQSPPQPVNE